MPHEEIGAPAASVRRFCRPVPRTGDHEHVKVFVGSDQGIDNDEFVPIGGRLQPVPECGAVQEPIGADPIAEHLVLRKIAQTTGPLVVDACALSAKFCGGVQTRRQGTRSITIQGDFIEVLRRGRICGKMGGTRKSV